MSEPLAQYSFFSWLRRGVSTGIARREGDGTVGPRALIHAEVAFNTGTLSAGVDLGLFGAGEVSSFDVRTIIRTWPRPDSFDVESNFFALIEFDQPDLPWRLTPAHAGTAQRLRPGLALVVLRDDEGTYTAAAAGQLPSIGVNRSDSLPDLAQAYAWAHVQINGDTDVTPDELVAAVANEPWRVRSRIVCPRQLEPETEYTAYLVPALERGRLRGLNQPVPDTVDGLEPAWQPQPAGVRLPVYYQWRFRTGEAGDFESLVRRLVPRILPPEVGIRDMGVQDPGGALRNVPAHTGPLGLEGALKTVATRSTMWTPGPTRTTFIDRLKTLLNTAAAMLKGTTPTRAVTPPLYGRWHAAQEELAPGQLPVWFQELNQDPRCRVTAGLGTLVIQQEQRDLMAEAWRQVEGILKLNEEFRLAQLARGLAERMHLRQFQSGGVDSVLQLTAPVHARVMGSPTTIRAQIAGSPVPPGTFDGQLRRVARPLGPLGRRQGRPALPPDGHLVERLNTGELRPAAPPRTPDVLPTPSRLGGSLVPGSSAEFDWVRRLPAWFLLLLAVLLVLGALALGPVAIGFLALGIAALVVFARPQVNAFIAAVRAALRGRDLAAEAEIRAAALRDDTLRPDQVTSAPPQPEFSLREPPATGTSAPAPAAPVAAGTDSPDARIFRAATAEVLADIHAPTMAGRTLTSVDLTAARQKLLTALEPGSTIAAALRARLHLAPDIIWQPEDPIEPIMAYPKFDRPMYEPLRDLGQDWLLPGLELIPVNTVALLISNQPFIEAYMVGLNHEMARELLWNEYPTTQRGSYFRQFWDVRGFRPPPGQTVDPEKLKDIKEIHGWNRHLDLGGHSARPPMPNNEERVVLLVRGDLLRRYPNTEVLAIKAGPAPNRFAKRTLLTEELPPSFGGTLRPDVFFYGFDLTPTQVIGAEDPSDTTVDQGWFFVLREQPAEPRFGLDLADDGAVFGTPVATPNDLSWASLAASRADLSHITYPDLNAQLPDTRPLAATAPAWHADAGLGRTGATSADLADFTLQRPVMIAIHASDMLRGTQ